MGNNPVTDQNYIYIKSDERDNNLREQARTIADKMRQNNPEEADAFLRNVEYLLDIGDPVVIKFIEMRASWHSD